MSTERRRETVYTVGHSNRDADELVSLLESSKVDVLVDVRRFPSSRFNPQFNRKPLRSLLARHAIEYEWRGEELGGRRERGSDATHVALTPSMRGYASHMEQDIFLASIEELVSRIRTERLALMCAERHPVQCHRSLIADHLVVVRSLSVHHLIEIGTTIDHSPHPHARRVVDRLVYDDATQMSLGL